ncbi:unnamed protein product [Amoebophrya sp. A120]|nr:unnamed protein product [Amoebophrya sp. A120]|eukprot:GSA120T00002836001.1
MTSASTRSATRSHKSSINAARQLLADAEAAFNPHADEHISVASSTPSGSRKPSKGTLSSTSRVSKFFDDEGVTFRNGIAGEHYEMGAALVDCSSTSKTEDAHWSSAEEEGEQWCIYDLGERTVLTELNFKFAGGGCMPQCVAISYCTASSLKEAKTATFISVKRSFVPQDSTKLHMGFRCEDAARFWKVSYPINWGGEKTVVADMQFIAEDVGSRKLCKILFDGFSSDARAVCGIFFVLRDFCSEMNFSHNALKGNGLKQMSLEHSSQLGRLCNIFNETATLNDAQKEVRAIARKHNIPLGDAETLRVKFEKYDADGSGQISKDEFSCILRELIRVKNVSDIPQERFNHYWREVDLDHSGEISFEEFLVWYKPHLLLFCFFIFINIIRDEAKPKHASGVVLSVCLQARVATIKTETQKSGTPTL